MAGIDSYTKLLLPCDGADTSTDFPDSSSSSHVVTAINNAQVDTAQKKFGTGSALFDGTDDYLTVPDHADWNLAGDNFTLECLVRWNNLPADGSSHGLIGQWDTVANEAAFVWYINRSGATYNHGFSWSTNGSAGTVNGKIVASTGLSTSTWYHFAVVRSVNNLYFFQGGVQQGATADVTGVTIFDSSNNLTIGAYIEGGTNIADFDGHIDELRISDSARWTSNFIPPTKAYGPTFTQAAIY